MYKSKRIDQLPTSGYDTRCSCIWRSELLDGTREAAAQRSAAERHDSGSRCIAQASCGTSFKQPERSIDRGSQVQCRPGRRKWQRRRSPLSPCSWPAAWPQGHRLLGGTTYSCRAPTGPAQRPRLADPRAVRRRRCRRRLLRPGRGPPVLPSQRLEHRHRSRALLPRKQRAVLAGSLPLSWTLPMPALAQALE